jgi:hypothetical protein
MNEMTIQKQLDEFFVGIQAGVKSLKDVRSVYDERIAFDFNAISFFDPNENKISEIIAYFLDPQNSHGQKDKFLRCFVNIFKLSKAIDCLNAGMPVEVKLESSANAQRRIDIIVIFGNNDFIIGIENKIWGAPEQKNQVGDYIDSLSDKSQDRYVLFYLSPTGDLPSGYSIDRIRLTKLIEDKKIQVISCDNDLISLFKNYEAICLADNVRSFIRDFVNYINKEMKGESIMGESDFIVDYILKDETNEKLKLAMRIDSEIKIVKDKIIKDMVRQYQEISEETEVPVEIDEYSLPTFTPNGWKDLCIHLKGEGGGIIYGISHKNNPDKTKAKLSKYLENKIGMGEWGSSEWWPCCREYKNWYTNVKYFEDIRSGSLKKEIKQLIIACKNIDESELRR